MKPEKTDSSNNAKDAISYLIWSISNINFIEISNARSEAFKLYGTIFPIVEILIFN